MGLFGTVRQSLEFLSPRDTRLLAVATVIQMGTSFLDLAGVLLLGLVGALAAAVIQGQAPPLLAEELIERLGLGDLSTTDLLALFALTATGLLLSKSVISTLLMRRIFLFLANRQVAVSSQLTSGLLTRDVGLVQRRSSQERAFALVQGTTAAIITVLGQGVVAVAELALLAVLGVALFMASPYIALGAMSYFALLAWGLHLLLGRWATRVGDVARSSDISSYGALQEAIAMYRELTVFRRQSFYIEKVIGLRLQAARALADIQFMGNVSKYAYEAALVIGGLVLALVLFSTQTIEVAVGTLTLFVAAATRIMPSLLRLQLAALTIRNASGQSKPALDLAGELRISEPLIRARGSVQASLGAEDPNDFRPTIDVRDVQLVYPGASTPALDGVTFAAGAGKAIALAGKSGAGKSTLADIILGVLEPTSGVIRVGGLSPSAAIDLWPEVFAYVPQEATLANASIRENIALGLPSDLVDDDAVWNALELVDLGDFVRRLPGGLSTQASERGTRFSGGQRQRLGLARALYHQPKLLVLDEATSALDAETEELVSRTIRRLEGEVTTVIIAHRLSTIRDVDQLIYLEQGRVAGVGTFNEVREQVRALDRQAQIIGIPRST